MKRVARVMLSPEKGICDYKVGPYRISLRQKSYKLPRRIDPTFELTIWNGWLLCDKTDWSNQYFANRAFEKAKRTVATELAKKVLFNQPEDQDNE
jgi:hypothetical protein